MPTPSFPDLSRIDPNDQKAILEALVRLQKELTWLLDGNLDRRNIDIEDIKNAINSSS